jgi:hypothetical protein
VRGEAERLGERTLTWKDPGVRLGFTVLDPVGTEIDSTVSKEEFIGGKIKEDETKVSLHIDRLGECRKGEKYSVCVFSLSDVRQPVDFTLEYSSHQNFSKVEGDCLASASNGAVLASVLNAPLLYTSPSEFPDVTKKVLYKLGVKNVYLVNLGDHLSRKAKDEIKEIVEIKENFVEPRQIYDTIRDICFDKKAL